jgi:hypothetical protein
MRHRRGKRNIELSQPATDKNNGKLSGAARLERLGADPSLYPSDLEESVMSEFTFLYRSATVPTPEQSQKTLHKWAAWMKELGTQGHMKNPGHPLEGSGKVVSSKTVSDGPYAEAKDIVGGFSVILATDLAQATELARGCPILDVGGSVEVRPVRPMNM